MTEQEFWEEMLSIEWVSHPKYGQPYLTVTDEARMNDLISLGLKLNLFPEENRSVLRSIARRGGKNRIQVFTRLENEPRRIARAFTSKKNIRQWVFNRDGNRRLKCGSSKSLTVDHIIPISRGGENKLSNIQTLCRSCNSSKSDRYIDYR